MRYTAALYIVARVGKSVKEPEGWACRCKCRADGFEKVMKGRAVDCPGPIYIIYIYIYI